MRHFSLGESLRQRRVLLVVVVISGAAVVISSSTALGSRSLVATCAISVQDGLSAADLQCFWETELSSASQEPSPLLGSPTVAAKASPDECFAGIGNPYPTMQNGACPPGSVPKANQTYTWGLTKPFGRYVWIGTASNIICFAAGKAGFPPFVITDRGSFTLQSTWPLPATNPPSRPRMVCELGQSQGAKRQVAPVPATIGDWRMPRVYRYDVVNKTLHDMTTGRAAAALSQIIGLRTAGTLNGVVLLGGPSLSQSGGIRLVAFDAATGRYIGSKAYPQYEDIRKWVVVGGQLYTAVGTLGPVVDGVPSVNGGRILRWTGTLHHPFSFQEVGKTDNDPAEIGAHREGADQRLFVSTWSTTSSPAGLWMSPTVPAGGLTRAQLNGWRKMWDVNRYEPDAITADDMGTGALASFGGWLYWGTMQVPEAGGHSQTSDLTVRTLGGHHPLSIWRGRNLSTRKPEIQLVYGDAKLPVDTTANTGTAVWQLADNRFGGRAGLCGPGGFGNFWNAYTWTMAVLGRHLYVGTGDWRVLSDLGQPSSASGWETRGLVENSTGADLWRFDLDRRGAPTCARAESVDGLGNPTNFGIRTLIADGTHLWAGTATMANLLDAGASNPAPQGGWQLFKLGR